MRKESYHKLVCDILEEYGELDTGEIYQEFKERMPYRVPAINGLTNILARSPKIKKTGFVQYYEGRIRRRYNLWMLKD